MLHLLSIAFNVLFCLPGKQNCEWFNTEGQLLWTRLIYNNLFFQAKSTI